MSEVNDAFAAGGCVRQSMVSPPELVALDPREGAIRPIVSLAPRYAAIAPLKVVPRIWTNRNGFDASGFVVYPRNYEAGRSYQAILVTHGSDRSEGRRGGKGCVRKCRSRWSPYH